MIPWKSLPPPAIQPPIQALGDFLVKEKRPVEQAPPYAFLRGPSRFKNLDSRPVRPRSGRRFAGMTERGSAFLLRLCSGLEEDRRLAPQKTKEDEKRGHAGRPVLTLASFLSLFFVSFG